MKFISSLILAMIVSIAIILVISALLLCPHNNKIEMFSFQPEHSYVEYLCKKCDERFGHTTFQGNPSDDSYIDVIEKHVENNIVTASVGESYYDRERMQIKCTIKEGDVFVFFEASFKEEYESYLDSLSIGDKITFRGKCSETGFYWTDCEILNTDKN